MSISFIGDIILGRYDSEPELGYSSFYHTLDKDIYRKTKNILALSNLETTITNRRDKINKLFNFLLNPNYSDLLKVNKNTCFSLALRSDPPVSDN